MTLLAEEKDTDFGDRLRYWRKLRGLTLQELGERCGMLQPAIARLEKGGLQPRWDTVKRLAAALDVTPNDFLSLPVPKGKRRKRGT